MTTPAIHPLIIIGSGPAGYSAAVYAARAGLNPLMLSGYAVGGQLMTTTDVENWIGDADDLTGPILMERMRKHAEKMGVSILQEQVQSVEFSQQPFTLHTDNNTYQAQSVIIATGASARYLGLASEQAFMGKGVSACATCDGFFFRNQDVAVVGGGNTAFEEAIYLSNLCKKVYLIHRREGVRADQVLQRRLDRLVDEGKIVKQFNYVLNEVVGDASGVTGAVIDSTLNEGESMLLDVTGVFIAIGHTPNTSLFKDYLDLDESGYLKVIGGSEGNATQTSIPGVFAAGDVSDHVYRQAITSAGTGCMAALDAERYLSSLND